MVSSSRASSRALVASTSATELLHRARGVPALDPAQLDRRSLDPRGALLEPLTQRGQLPVAAGEPCGCRSDGLAERVDALREEVDLRREVGYPSVVRALRAIGLNRPDGGTKTLELFGGTALRLLARKRLDAPVSGVQLLAQSRDLAVLPREGGRGRRQG